MPFSRASCACPAPDELVQHCHETAERVTVLELHRPDRIRLALDSKKSDPRVADTLIPLSERVAKLRGLDALPDFSRLPLDELLIFEALCRKGAGAPQSRVR